MKIIEQYWVRQDRRRGFRDRDGRTPKGIRHWGSHGQPHGTFVKSVSGVRVLLQHYTEPLVGIVIQGQNAHPGPGNEHSLKPLGAGALLAFSIGEPPEANYEGNDFAVFLIFKVHPWVLEMN